MDDWGWQELQPWLERRLELPIGPLFCVINGTTGGRPWATAAARAQLRRTAAAAGVRRRFAPHQLRHAHAVEMAREGVPLIVIQRQLGHSNLGITSVYLQGIDNAGWAETNVLVRPRDGRQVGRAALSCSILVLVEGEPALEQCIGAAEVRGGSLMFYGLLSGPRSTLTVIGGTGRYRHARGTLTLRLLDEHCTRWTFALAR